MTCGPKHKSYDKMEWGGGNKLERVHVATLVRYRYFVIFVSYRLLSENVIFYYVLSYLTCPMACLMKNQRGLHYPEITTNFVFELEI